MKKILSIFLMILTLVSCTQTEDVRPAMGTVSLESLSKQAENPELVTRTVDDDLQVDVLDAEGTVLYHFAEGEATAGLNGLMLDAGSYKLRAYTANRQTIYTNAERGEAKYYGETTFQVQAGRHIRVGLQVPMTNIAVSFVLPDEARALFTNIHFSLNRGTRTLEIAEGETAYFDLDPADADLNYALEVTNADNEKCQQEKYLKAADQRPGTLYTITYAMGQLGLR